MSKFLTPLNLEMLSHEGRGTWRVVRPLAYQSDLKEFPIVVPSGFITDLASVPRIPIAFLAVGGLAHRAAVIHDWLYTSHEVSRAMADRILAEAARLDGVTLWQSWLLWAGVRVGGFGSWKAAGPKQPAHIKEHLARLTQPE